VRFTHPALRLAARGRYRNYRGGDGHWRGENVEVAANRGAVATMELGPLGDRGFLAWFATEDEAARWAAAVRARGWTGIDDVVAAYQAAAVHADPRRIDLDQLEAQLRALPAVRPAQGRGLGRLIILPVLYDGADLAEVARRLDLTEAEVIAHHAGTDYHVFALGFLPGFPYTGYLPACLSGLPRRDSPRTRVPAGAVAIAGRQTSVYPQESPGGWHLIGRTPLRIVDLETSYFPIRAGDRIRFEPIGAAQYAQRRGELLQ
jgi:KipI family sensor histidine kinase inhibitor